MSGAGWWRTALYISVSLLVVEGAALVMGYVAVTIPGETWAVSTQPGPTWLFVIGLALGLCGMAIVICACLVGRRRGEVPGQRLSESIEAHRPLWNGAVALAVVTFVGLQGLVSIVSTGSALRWEPLIPTVLCLVAGSWYWVARRLRTTQS